MYKKHNYLLVGLIVITLLLFSLNQSFAQTEPIPWNEFRPSVSAFDGFDITGSYRYFDDRYEDDRDNTSVGNLKFHYKNFRDGPESGYSIDLQTKINTYGDFDFDYTAGGHSSFKHYYEPGEDLFFYGGLNMGASSAYVGELIMASVGLGQGRFYDVTPLGQAVEIERKLMEIGDISQGFGQEFILNLAAELNRIVDDQETLAQRTERIAGYIEENSPEQPTLRIESTLALREIQEVQARRRTYGWEIKAGIGYPIIVPENMSRQVSIVGEASYGVPINRASQLNTSMQISTPFNNFGDVLNMGLQGDLHHIIDENITLGASAGFNFMKDGIDTHNSWSVGGEAEFDLRRNLSFIVSLEVTDSSAYEEATFDFSTSFSYKLF